MEEKEKETAERLKTLQTEEKERMIQPTIQNRVQTRYDVEELDESYYIMDGSKTRVTFDDDETPIQEELPPTETNGNDVDEQEEEEVDDTVRD